MLVRHLPARFASFLLNVAESSGGPPSRLAPAAKPTLSRSAHVASLHMPLIVVVRSDALLVL
jgi:hypothetical protein